MKEMTSYERVMTALDGGRPDRVPVIPFLRDWGIRHSGFTFAEILDNPCMRTRVYPSRSRGNKRRSL